MFTGIVSHVGRVTRLEPGSEGTAIEVDLGPVVNRCGIGDSVSLSGACCTVVGVRGSEARFELTEETLARTWFGRLRAGTRLNVEPALRVGDPIGGHIVQGHVDGLGSVLRPVGAGGGEWWIRVPDSLQRYCVQKGSITCDGVSLTIAAIDQDRLMAAIIPHTAEATTIGGLHAGDPLNLEVDVLAKYVERLLASRMA